MSGNRWAFAVLMLISLVPDSSEACLFCHGRRRPFDRCGVCSAPSCAAPSCAAPSCAAPCCPPMLPAPCAMPCFTPCPPPQPCLVPQQITTYRDVPQTCYRQEAVCVNVPVTVYQQQIAYRTVPVTTMARVPVTETRMVPMMPGCSAPIGPSCSAPCAGGMMIPGDIPSLAPATPTPYGMPSVPGTTVVPSSPVLPKLGMPTTLYNPPTGSAQLIPVPTAKDPVETTRTSAAEEWSPVERRAAFFQQEFGYKPFGRVQQVGFTSH